MRKIERTLEIISKITCISARKFESNDECTCVDMCIRAKNKTWHFLIAQTGIV